jgi:hypothetical protein
MPGAFLIVNLGEPFRVRGGADLQASYLADGCVVSVPTRALAFSYPPWTRSVGIHFKAWKLAPFLPMPVTWLCDRPATLDQVWSRPAVGELRTRLAAANGPHETLTILEGELLRRLREIPGPDLVRRTSGVIVETRGTAAILTLSADAGVSSTHLTQRFKEIIGRNETAQLPYRSPGNGSLRWSCPLGPSERICGTRGPRLSCRCGTDALCHAGM